jgi:CRISPR/Cas system CSM-associated protein Csm3 (group 7 of RAMP superfamily)
VLHRDPDTGRVELRGSTVAGVLRHELDERLQGYPSQAPGSRAVGPDRPEHAAVRALFGGAGDDDLASPLTVFDATVEGPIAITGGDGESGGEPETRLRSGIALDPCTAVARTGALFTSEALLAGARFVVSFELVVDNPDREPELLRLLVSAAHGLRMGGARFGRRTATGNGVVHADGWVVRRLTRAPTAAGRSGGCRPTRSGGHPTGRTARPRRTPRSPAPCAPLGPTQWTSARISTGVPGSPSRPP